MRLAILGSLLIGVAPSQMPAAEKPKPLRVIIMDPLSAPLACACVKGFGQRDYRVLAIKLAKAVKRPVKLIHAESLKTAFTRAGRAADVVIGKHSIVLADSKSQKFKLTPFARLTDLAGRTDLVGLFVVPAKHPAKKIADLAKRKVALGPIEDRETHDEAMNSLIAAGVAEKAKLDFKTSPDSAAYAVADGEVDAAVIPDYMLKLLEGCGKIDRGSLRVLHRTNPVPFVTVFHGDEISAAERRLIETTLLSIKDDAKALKALETRGFRLTLKSAGWTDWRGTDRLGLCPQLPKKLPAKPQTLWSAKLTGPALAGIAATEKFVVVPDKDAALKNDVFRCFDAKTGQPLWTVRYAAAKKLDYSNAPRACPVIHKGRVYLQGALGDLHCVELATGKTVWKRNIVKDFGAELITWGCSSPPLVVDDKLVINPGGPKAALVALELKTGKVRWKTPGNPAAYAAFLLWKVHGKRLIVGYDAAGLAGWDPQTGKQLWSLIPPGKADFNVGTPVPFGNNLIVATENNATRMYAFDQSGMPSKKPIALNDDLAPDTSTPVLIDGRLFCTAYGTLFCLDLRKKLKTIYSIDAEKFHDHCNLVAGNGRVLVWTTSGDLLLLDATSKKYRVVSQWRPFSDPRIETMSHPAIVGDRIYLRSKNKLLCLRLK